jgi:hypothetical protein
LTHRFAGPPQEALVSTIPTSLSVQTLHRRSSDLPLLFHKHLLATFGWCQEDTCLGQTRLPKAQWTSPPVEFQLTRSAQTEFVICDYTIELVFKLCKSYCGLDYIAGYRRERILVELYAKLIGVVLTHFLVAPLRMSYGAHTNREISPVKVRQIFQRFARGLNRSLGDYPKFQSELSEMLTHIRRFGFKEKRTKEPNVCHALALVSVLCSIDADTGNEYA